MSNSTISECNIYVGYRKKPTLFGLNSVAGYEGIPQNFILNVVGWGVMIIIFSILRKKAWNYGRIALFENNETIYVQTNVVNINERDSEEGSEESCSSEDVVSDSEEAEENQDHSKLPHTDEPLQNSNIAIPNSNYEATITDDEGLFSWIKTVLTLTDEQYLEKSGIDCVQYLSFQRHLIFLAIIITFSSLVIILPINYQNKSYTPEATKAHDGFFQTSILNVGKDSKLLWVHVLLALLFFILNIAVMRHFHSSLKEDSNTGVYSSIMITGLTRNNCHEEKVREHFSEAYPDVRLIEVNFAYDISDLKDMETLRQGAASAKRYWLNYFREKNKRPLMRPFVCGTMCFCCGKSCGCKEADAIDYYTSKELLYHREERSERKKALTKPLGIAFVTFATPEMAARVLKDYRCLPKYLRMTPASKLTPKLNSRYWSVNYAPLPADLYWENLALSPIYWYIKIAIINIILLVVVIFYTTPVFLLNNLEVLKSVSKFSSKQNFSNSTTPTPSSVIGNILVDTIPTLLLWICAVTLPSLVSVSDRFVQFWTKTAENRSKMIKIYSYLMIMVIIFPSLGITSFSVLLQKYKTDWDKQFKFKCVFSAENGGLFVNYLCTSTFLGTASELMRLPELLVYVIKIFLSRSPAENSSIRSSVLWEFQLGSQYAWMMLNFTIFTVFSLIYPMIAPFGLVYIILKHYVDRYNIYFAYGRTKVAKEVHVTAVTFSIVCMFLVLPILIAYMKWQPKADGQLEDDLSTSLTGLHAFCVVSMCFITAIFIGQVFFNMVMGTTLKPYNIILKEREINNASGSGGNQPVWPDNTNHAELGNKQHDNRTTIVMGRYFPKILRPEKANYIYVPAGAVAPTSRPLNGLSEPVVKVENFQNSNRDRKVKTNSHGSTVSEAQDIKKPIMAEIEVKIEGAGSSRQNSNSYLANIGTSAI